MATLPLLLLSSLSVLSGIALAGPAAGAGGVGKPNVLFMVVDDLGTALEVYGGLAITPNLKRLAAKGTQMRSAFVSIAVCAPSRTAFLTGLRPDTTQVWTIGPYFRATSRGEGMEVVTLPQMFRMHGYNTTGSGKIFHPGTPSGGIITSEGGGDMCPAQVNSSRLGQKCQHRPAVDEPGSWTEPYWFCDQYTNDTVQSPSMQQWTCSLSTSTNPNQRLTDAVYTWPSCGGGCVQNDTCIACFEQCGTWGVGGAWDACDCPDECYPEGVIADQTIRILESKVNPASDGPAPAPWFHATGFKRPHLSYRAPTKYFDMYDLEKIPLPLHPLPSPSAPPISYAHTCINDNHAAEQRDSEFDMGGALYKNSDGDDSGAACVQMVMNRTRAEFNNSAESYIEIIQNETKVRQLRLAYYATVTLMDAQLGRVLDSLEATGLDKQTIVTFIGDHGYQNGEKGEWCKTTNFELATRIPMFVVVPESLGPNWARGHVETTVVESIDLMVTLADIAGLPLPKQALGGESLRPLILTAKGLEMEAVAPRQKTWALSQWARRPSCTVHHGCEDGHGNPYDPLPDQSIMGYKLRTDRWAYTAWMSFNWGEGSDPKGEASVPVFSDISALELYDHEGDTGDLESGEKYEWDNLAYDPAHKQTVAKLHAQLEAIVKKSLVKPMTPPAFPLA